MEISPRSGRGSIEAFWSKRIWNFSIGIGPRKLKINLVFSLDQGICFWGRNLLKVFKSFGAEPSPRSLRVALGCFHL